MYHHELYKEVKDLCRRLRQSYLLIKPTRLMIGGKEYVIEQIDPCNMFEVLFFNNSEDLNTKKTTLEENQRIWDAIEENFKNVPMSEVEYFGRTIQQYRWNDYRCTINGVELRATSLSDIKEKINEFDRKAQRERICERISREFGTSQEANEFFINMVVSFHSCEGGALNRIEDYLNAKGL